MENNEIKTEQNPSSSEEIIEKRIKTTVIRRRKKKEPPKVEKKEEVVAASEVKETEKQPKEVEEAAVEVEKAPKVKAEEKEEEKVAAVDEEKAPKVEEKTPKKRGLTIIAEPEEVKEEDKAASSVVVRQKEEADKDKFVRKAPKKKKSKAELNYEEIKRGGGLKQFVGSVSEEEGGYHTASRSRVFEPGMSRRKKKVKKAFKKTQITEKKASKKVIKVNESIQVSELSQSMGVKASEIIKKLMGLDIMATVNQMIDVETASLIASEYGYEVENVGFKEEEVLKVKVESSAKGDALARPPVVTVMGHVDHGKTSILDVIREAKVAEGEAGGITQHIGAYTVEQSGHVISFVDTPGHEAFTHMRARGAQVTDIVILVVAADDGVMPQTKEAIDHAQAAGVPIIVAINKIDKQNAAPDKVKRELAENGLQPEDWGGDTICVPTSAVQQTGIDQLLEMVLLQAEMLDLKAVKDCPGKGIIIESRMDKRRGPVVSGIVKEGTLRVGDPLVSGAASGKVRALKNDKGEDIKEAYPSQPVEIMGLTDVPEAGELFTVVEDEKKAKLVSESRQQKQREELLSSRRKVTLEDFLSGATDAETKTLNLIVKTDVKGVADAVKDSLPGLSTKDVKVKVLSSGVGGIVESDVMLASASEAVILGFNVVADPSARELAEKEGIDIKTYSVIYEMMEDIKKAIVGLLAPKEVEKVLGRAEVRETFKVPKLGVIAGCMVTNGKITRSAKLRLLRDNVIIHVGNVASLRRFKDDAKEVASGMECGIGIERYQDIKIGDEIEAFLIEEVKTTWEDNRE